jgi:hypothetical protein
MKFRYNTIMQFFSTKKTTIEKTNLFIPIPVKGNKYNKYDKCKNEKNNNINPLDKTKIFIPVPEKGLPHPWQKEIL